MFSHATTEIGIACPLIRQGSPHLTVGGQFLLKIKVQAVVLCLAHGKLRVDDFDLIPGEIVQFVDQQVDPVFQGAGVGVGVLLFGGKNFVNNWKKLLLF